MTILKLHTIARKNGFYVEFDRSVTETKLVVRDSRGSKWVNVSCTEAELPKACEIVANTMKEKRLWL